MNYKNSESRIADVVNAYYNSMKIVLSRNPEARRDDILNETIKKTAPRFYITFENARRFVSMLNRGMEIPITNENKRMMYNEIYRRFKERKSDDYGILRDILDEPAPSFYLSYWEVSGIIYKYLRKK